MALLPCEPAVGRVVVVCWQLEIASEDRTAETGADDVDHVWELARLNDGQRLDDPKALREALALVSMAEAIEELADPETLDELVSGLDAWCERASAGADMDEPADANADADGGARARANVIAAVAKSVVRTIDLIRVIDGNGARIATPLELDRIGGLLRELEREFTSTERAAERWAQGSWDSDRELVEGPWTALSVARRGPLRQPVSAALEQGREAGLALAAQVTGGA